VTTGLVLRTLADHRAFTQTSARRAIGTVRELLVFPGWAGQSNPPYRSRETGTRTGLKSRGAYAPCGFDPHLRHHTSLGLLAWSGDRAL